MIEGYFADIGKQSWPMVAARVSIPLLSLTTTVEFLIDTGSEWSTLGPKAASDAGVSIEALSPVEPVVGVGGSMPAVLAEVEVSIGQQTIPTQLYVLVPGRGQRRRLYGLPSAMGRDLLSHFTLVMDASAHRVLLLETGDGPFSALHA